MKLQRTMMAMLALTYATSAMAREPRSNEEAQELIKSSYIHIDGMQTPELIPYHARMNMFFSAFTFFEADLKPNLTGADYQVLKDFAAQHGKVLQTDAAKHEADWREIASRAESMNAVELAGEIKLASQRIEAVSANRYRAVVNTLSPDGQRIVNDYVVAKVRPTTMVEDPLVVAVAAPDFYKAQIVGVYRLMQEGKWPAAAPAVSTLESKQKMLETGEVGLLGTP